MYYVLFELEFMVFDTPLENGMDDLGVLYIRSFIIVEVLKRIFIYPLLGYSWDPMLYRVYGHK